MSPAAMTAIAPVDALPRLDRVNIAPIPVPTSPVSASTSFSQLLSGGIENVNANLLQADKMARAFALDDSIPVHQVTYALEQARLSLDLALQVRTRLIDGYQQLMNMQL